jgi:Got1/Sft2-like family
MDFWKRLTGDQRSDDDDLEMLPRDFLADDGDDEEFGGTMDTADDGDDDIVLHHVARPDAERGFWSTFLRSEQDRDEEELDNVATDQVADDDEEKDQRSWWQRFGSNDNDNDNDGNGNNDDDVDVEQDVAVAQQVEGATWSQMTSSPVDWFRQRDREEPKCWQDFSAAIGLPSLTFRQRAYGFFTCLAIGIALDALATAAMLKLTAFAVLYTLGNICTLCSTFFLVGPARQAKNMFKPVRAAAASIYLVSMVVTLYAAIRLESFVLCAVMIVVQGCALIWYTLSFVPFGRQLLKRFLRRCFNFNFESI